MNYTDLKNGDVIVLTNYGNRIVIFNKIKDNKICSSPQLYTYVELDENVLSFEKDEPNCFYLIENINFRLSTIEEKTKLYNAIGKHFTEEYDKDWYNHFTDSSYFDIQDYLLDVFCIEVNEYDDDLLYPDFINEIHTYIWDKLCVSLGYKPYDGNEFVEELVNKQEFIDNVCEWIRQNWRKHIHKDSDGMIGFIGWESELRKAMEE
jgi:hypothetical protein